jgi:phosphoglycerate kinase
MRVVTPEIIEGQRVLLRLDLDVPLQEVDGKMVVADDSRLKAGLPTLEMCLDTAKSVVVMGHLGRPEAQEDPKLSVAPVVDWFESQGLYIGDHDQVEFGILENLRFEVGEEACAPSFARSLAELGDIFINESFAAYRESASTTVLPRLIPSMAGLNFAAEVVSILQFRNQPISPCVVVMGGAKVEDKLKLIKYLQTTADCVLVGGKLVGEIKDQNLTFGQNVILGSLNEAGTDITQATIDSWSRIISLSKTIIWNGPLGKIENGDHSTEDGLILAQGTYQIAQAIFNSNANILIGGGDTIGFLQNQNLIPQSDKLFISTGGGAMLKLLESGSLPTIDALNHEDNNPK